MSEGSEIHTFERAVQCPVRYRGRYHKMHSRFVFALLVVLLSPVLALCGDLQTSTDFLALTSDCKLIRNGTQYRCMNEVKDVATGEVIMAGGIESRIGMEASAETKIEMPEGMRTITITTNVEANKAKVQLRIMDGETVIKQTQMVLSLAEGVE